MKKSFLIFLSIAFLLPGALLKSEPLVNNVIKKDILANWEFSKADSLKWYHAVIPGCVHTDLLNNKLIPDPYFGTNEHALQWIGKEDWIYKTSFDVPPALMKKKNIELVFKGLDTYADVYLNDSLILSADNMFREWRIQCKGLLKEKDNYLKIYFNSVFKVNMPKWENAPFRLMAFPNNDQSDTMIAMYSRKAQFHYGWDWDQG